MQTEVFTVDKQGYTDDQTKALPVFDPTVKDINKNLRSRFGQYNGRQVYRVVFSENLWETEIKFEDDQYRLLPEPVAFKRRKYDYIYNRWILEKLVIAYDKHIARSDDYHYEPIYVFWGVSGEYLEPNQHVVDLIMNALLNGTPWTKAEWEAMSEKQQEKEIDTFFSIISNESNPLLSALHAKEAILNAGHQPAPESGIVQVAKESPVSE